METLLHGQGERVAVAGGQKLSFASAAPLPDGSNGVDDIGGRKAVAAGNASLPGGATAQATAFGEQIGPGGAVDGTVHAVAATRQSRRSGDQQCIRAWRRPV
jgi:hypothetical protein